MNVETSFSPSPEPPVTPVTAVAASPSTLHKAFIGKDGLRAIWSVILFFLIFAGLMSIAFAIGKIIHPTQQSPKAITELSLKFAFINEGILVIATLLATWILSKIERRGRSYGFAGTDIGKRFVSGLACGMVLISLLVLTLWKGGLLVVERRLIFGPDVLRYGVLWLIAFSLVGVFEESLTRGFLLYTLTRGLTRFYERVFKTTHGMALGFWTAAVILSTIFFLGHTGNPGESPVGLLSVFAAGMFFCLSIWRTGSIWWAIGMHAAWDWGQSYLYGVADSGLMVQHHLLATHPHGTPLLSGGTTGPEGSIFVLAVLVLGSLLILFLLPQGRYYHEPIALEQPPLPVPDQPQPSAIAAV